jgi:hypothetical protein
LAGERGLGSGDQLHAIGPGGLDPGRDADRDLDGLAPPGEPLIDLEEDEAARAVVFALLAEMERK